MEMCCAAGLVLPNSSMPEVTSSNLQYHMLGTPWPSRELARQSLLTEISMTVVTTVSACSISRQSSDELAGKYTYAKGREGPAVVSR